MSTASFRIREAADTDVPALLELMRELAVFERYAEDFAVTEEELLKRGFPVVGEPEFYAVVAVGGAGGLVGYAVYYLVPFTYDLKPTLVLKELFVGSADRSSGLGSALFDFVHQEAQRLGCGQIKWTVLADNQRAKEFYQQRGGIPDSRWEGWRRTVSEEQPAVICARGWDRAGRAGTQE